MLNPYLPISVGAHIVGWSSAKCGVRVEYRCRRALVVVRNELRAIVHTHGVVSASGVRGHGEAAWCCAHYLRVHVRKHGQAQNLDNRQSIFFRIRWTSQTKQTTSLFNVLQYGRIEKYLFKSKY